MQDLNTGIFVHHKILSTVFIVLLEEKEMSYIFIDSPTLPTTKKRGAGIKNLLWCYPKKGT